MKRQICILCVALVIFPIGSVWAGDNYDPGRIYDPPRNPGQTYGPPRETPCSGDCYRGRPLPWCKTFVITEFSALGKVAGSDLGYEGAPDFFGQFDLGFMGNVNRRHALGGTVFLKGSPESGQLGVAARVRRWLGNNFSADFSPGLGLFYEGDPQVKIPSFTGSVRLSYRDYVALIGSVEVVRKELWSGYPSNTVKEKTFSALYLGVTAQSKPGLVTTGLVVVAGAVTLITVAIAMAGWEGPFAGGWGDGY